MHNERLCKLRVEALKRLSVSVTHMNRRPTVSRPSIFALRKSLLRQTGFLPHEYLRYFLAILSPLCSFVTFGRQFFRLKLSDDIKSVLDDTRKYRLRQATFKRLRKVTNLILGPSAALLTSQ
jgi:hypothetical protein